MSEKEPHMHAYEGHDDGVPTTAIGYIDVVGYGDDYPDHELRAKFARKKFGKKAVIPVDDCKNNDCDAGADHVWGRYPVFSDSSILSVFEDERYS